MPKRYFLTEASHLKSGRHRRREMRRQQREIESAIAELESLIAEIERDEARSTQQSLSLEPALEPAELATAIGQLSEFDIDEALTTFNSLTDHDLDEILAVAENPPENISINHPTSANILSEPPAPPPSEIDSPIFEPFSTDPLPPGDTLDSPLLLPTEIPFENPTDIIEYPLIDFPPPQEVRVAPSPSSNPSFIINEGEHSPVEILIRSFNHIIHQEGQGEDIIEFPLTRRFDYNS